MFNRDEHDARKEDNARPDTNCLPIRIQSTTHILYDHEPYIHDFHETENHRTFGFPYAQTVSIDTNANVDRSMRFASPLLPH